MEQDKKLTSEKVVEIIITLAMALSCIVAVFALIWANWPVFRVALTFFFAILFGVAFGYYMADKFGKK